MSLSRRPFLSALSSAFLSAGAAPVPGVAAAGSTGDRKGNSLDAALADQDFGFRAGGSPAANRRALQKAVDEAGTILLPVSSMPIRFEGPVNLPSGARLIGRGSARTPLEVTGPVAFMCQAPDGADGEFQAPWLEDFALYCTGSGIRFNSEEGGFSDAEGQKSLMRPRLDRLRIRRSPAANGGSVGVEFNKCFDGMIQQCEISGFDTGYRGRGSDLIEINGRTRIANCNTLLEILSVFSGPYRFGYGTRIIGCDLLAAAEAFVKSSAGDVCFEGNFFEKGDGPLKGVALQVTVRDAFRFVGNRLALPASLVADLLAVTTAPGNLFAWEHNTNDGPAWGTTTWNAGAGQPYWINQTHRSRIIQRGSSGAVPMPFPFNTTDEPAEMPWRFAPSLPGLVNGDYGTRVRCVEGSFILPTNASDTGAISFRPISAPISGMVDVWIQARADAPGKEITIYHTNGGRFVETARQPLTTQLAWYRVFAGIRAENFIPFAMNRDAARTGNIYLRELRVHLAS